MHRRHIPFSRKVKHSGAKNGPSALRKTQSGGLSALLCLRLHASRLKIARAQVCRSFVLLCLLDGLQKVLRAGVTHRRFERTDLHEGSPRNLCDCFRAGRLALPQRALFLALLLLVRQAPLLHGRMETSVAVSTARSAAFRQPTAGGQIARKTSAAVFRFGRSVARLLQLRALHDLLPLRHQRVRLLPLPLRPTLRERQDHRLHPHSLSREGIGQELRRPIHQRPLRVARVPVWLHAQHHHVGVGYGNGTSSFASAVRYFSRVSQLGSRQKFGLIWGIWSPRKPSQDWTVAARRP